MRQTHRSLFVMGACSSKQQGIGPASVFGDGSNSDEYDALVQIVKRVMRHSLPENYFERFDTKASSLSKLCPVRMEMMWMYFCGLRSHIGRHSSVSRSISISSSRSQSINSQGSRRGSGRASRRASRRGSKSGRVRSKSSPSMHVRRLQRRAHSDILRRGLTFFDNWDDELKEEGSDCIRGSENESDGARRARSACARQPNLSAALSDNDGDEFHPDRLSRAQATLLVKTLTMHYLIQYTRSLVNESPGRTAEWYAAALKADVHVVFKLPAGWTGQLKPLATSMLELLLFHFGGPVGGDRILKKYLFLRWNTVMGDLFHQQTRSNALECVIL